jgi:DNA-binding MarR family transcriptional regulator
LATHAFYIESPTIATVHGIEVRAFTEVRTGVVLAGANERHQLPHASMDDGIVTSLELATVLDLSSTGLVVLSACETGVGDLLFGDSVHGVRRACHTAGAQSVISCMWPSRAFVGLTARSLAGIDGDVTLPQFRVLVVLAVRSAQRSVVIAEELGVNPRRGTRMCDRLVRKGLIPRLRSTSDRRVVRLRLARAGHDIVEQVINRRRHELARLVAAAADLRQPVVTQALFAFAQATDEPYE